MTYLKQNILSILVLVLFIYVMFSRTGGCGKPAPTKLDTVYSKQTVYEQQPTQYIPQYQPIIVESKQPVIIPQGYQLPTDPAAMKAYCEEIVKKYLTENRYRDSTVLRDSAGNNVGVFRTNDLVSENMIKAREPSYTLRFPHTIETITIIKPPVLTRQLYLGADLNGNRMDLIRDIGLGAIYKDKKDRLYKFGAGWSLPISQPYFEVGRYWKVKLK